MRGLMRWFVFTLLERARRAGRGNADQTSHGALVVSPGVDAGHREDTNKRPSGRSRSLGAWGAQLDMMDEEMREVMKNVAEREVYLKFLRGEDISDDEEYREDEDLEGDEDEDEETGNEEGDEIEEETGEEEAFRLFTDILRHGTDKPPRDGSVSLESPLNTPSSHTRPSSHVPQNSVSNGELVLAHLMHGHSPPNQLQLSSPGPLTRKRWNTLVDTNLGGRNPRASEVTSRSQNHQFDDMFESIEETDEPLDLGHPSVVARSQCVICMGSARDIICWPCRCLAMCDQCRESLATRSSSAKHHCPCCRQPVEGYSRIYIP